MNRLSVERCSLILNLLTEGSSIRSAARIAKVSKTNVLRLLRLAGETFENYQDEHLRNLTCGTLRLDEMWSFVYAKARTFPDQRESGETCGYG